MKELIFSPITGPFIALWSLVGFFACVCCMTPPYPLCDDFSRLQRIFFHLVTGPAGWLTGIWKFLSFY